MTAETLTTNYGFGRISIEKWLEMQLNNRLEIMNIRLNWYVLGKKPIGKPFERGACQSCPLNQ